MQKYILVSVELYVTLVAVQVALAGVLVALLLFRWPVVAGLVLAALVSGLVLWAIYRIVTSAARPMPQPERNAGATVDGRAVQSVEVMQP